VPLDNIERCATVICFLKDIAALFVRVLELAREMGLLKMGLLKMGTVGLDGTKIHANASRHSALSYEHAVKNLPPERWP
jgi:hypothetical protein